LKMDEKTAAKIQAQKEKYNAKRDPLVRCFLLQRGANTRVFSLITEVEADFFSLWNTYREQTEFRFAKDEPEFKDYFARANVIAYGEGMTGDSIDVFEIQPDARDKLFPDSVSPLYHAFSTRKANERYEI
jgi:hypothetical protein